MKKLFLPLFLLLATSYIGSANAVSSVDEYFTSLCISKSSTGFNWENNDWSVVDFTTGTKYLAKRVNPAEAEGYQCQGAKNRENDYYYTEIPTNEHQLIRDGCYVIKPFGIDFPSFKVNCSEVWSTFERVDSNTNPKTRKLETVMCWDRNFFFSPNGRFHTAKLHGDVDNSSTYKDSLSLTEGKCSVL